MFTTTFNGMNSIIYNLEEKIKALETKYVNQLELNLFLLNKLEEHGKEFQNMKKTIEKPKLNLQQKQKMIESTEKRVNGIFPIHHLPTVYDELVFSYDKLYLKSSIDNIIGPKEYFIHSTLWMKKLENNNIKKVTFENFSLDMDNQYFASIKDMIKRYITSFQNHVDIFLVYKNTPEIRLKEEPEILENCFIKLLDYFCSMFQKGSDIYLHHRNIKSFTIDIDGEIEDKNMDLVNKSVANLMSFSENYNIKVTTNSF